MNNNSLENKLNKKKAEVLAPAGTFEALKAGVSAGADAVYVGGSLFSARAFAGNFDKEEMLRAIDYCHINDVSLYMALNTLLRNEELAQVPEYMEPFYQAGIDGIIVQDLGVASVLKKNFPDLPLHASTQMSISSSFGVSFLKNVGFSRVVPARELSLSEIKSIKEKCDIEIECFVHGAMCFAYSGKCLLSSFIGGRSGNRGRCAQPCRQCYSVLEERNGQHRSEHNYAMSMKDMCTLDVLPQVLDAGVDSLKIEGRMKKPEYVAATVAAYRMAVDMYAKGTWDEKEIARAIDDMKDIYNRGGFSNGYYFMQQGPEMLAMERPNHTGLLVGKVLKVSPPDVFVKLDRDVNPRDVLEIRGFKAGEPGVELTSGAGASEGELLRLKGNNFKQIKVGAQVYRTRNNALIDRIDQEYVNSEGKILKLNAQVVAKVGEPLIIRIFDENTMAESCGNVVEKASNIGCDPEKVLEKMKKTGGTGVKLETVVDCDQDAFVPMSELNNLRRQAVEDFKIAVAEKYRRK